MTSVTLVFGNHEYRVSGENLRLELVQPSSAIVPDVRDAISRLSAADHEQTTAAGTGCLPPVPAPSAENSPNEQDGSAFAAVTSPAQLANAVGVEPLPSSHTARKPAGDDLAADNRDKGRGYPAGGADHSTNEAGPHISGGSDGNRSTPSSSAGGAKMDEGESPNPGQSDADASGNHCTKEEQAVAPIRRPVSFRPHCREPQLCRSGTRDHCWTCRKAMAESEAA